MMLPTVKSTRELKAAAVKLSRKLDMRSQKLLQVRITCLFTVCLWVCVANNLRLTLNISLMSVEMHGCAFVYNFTALAVFSVLVSVSLLDGSF